MEILANAVLFLAALGALWLFAGILIESVGRLAARFCVTGFTVAFFVLGFLTSISEISVAISSGLAGVPQVSTGNLLGASFVLLLFIIPLLAIAGNGISVRGIDMGKPFLLILAVILLPALLVMDGLVTLIDGFLVLGTYGLLAYTLRRRAVAEEENSLTASVCLPSRKVGRDGLLVVIGALAIFGASYLLVEQTVYFAGLLDIPSSLIGLVLLSLGTNVPELVIAIRAITQGRQDIAFGDYLGSASMNSLIFGFLAITNGGFLLEQTEFLVTTLLLIAGLVLLFLFARSRQRISRIEGILLISFYLCFVGMQTVTVLSLAS